MEKRRKLNAHFFLQLFSDEFLGMCCHFVCLVTADENGKFSFHNSCLGQNIIQISVTHEPSKLKYHISISSECKYMCFIWNYVLEVCNYSVTALKLGKNSKASTTNTMPAAWGKNSSSLGRRREWPGTSTTCTGFIFPFCWGHKMEKGRVSTT